MKKIKNVLIAIGTRPEAIKMAPLILAMRQSQQFKAHVVLTGQHEHNVKEILALFAIKENDDLAVMQENQTLSSLTSELSRRFANFLEAHPFDLLLVHGDTTSSMVAALIGFYHKIPVGHVEAGLRTHCQYSPFPEELNRSIIARIASMHFAPTAAAAANLQKENISTENIVITGNTVIDALLQVAEKIKQNAELQAMLQRQFLAATINKSSLAAPLAESDYLLLTMHRRENFGDNHKKVCLAIKNLLAQHPQHAVVLPVHPNPKVKNVVIDALAEHPRVILTKPLDYDLFTYLMAHAKVILTDSGGIQEEAPSLKKPVLVLRTVTERPEALSAGLLKVVGTDPELIYKETNRLLLSHNYYQSMIQNENPYGDGTAAAKIVRALENRRLCLPRSGMELCREVVHGSNLAG